MTLMHAMEGDTNLRIMARTLIVHIMTMIIIGILKERTLEWLIIDTTILMVQTNSIIHQKIHKKFVQSTKSFHPVKGLLLWGPLLLVS